MRVGTPNFTDDEKELFCEDLRGVCKEYFEGENNYAIDVITTQKGLSVCIVFDAVRIKNFKKAK